MHTLRVWFEWVDALPSSIAIRESLYGYPALLTTHVIGMAIFAGLIAMMDLRLVGIAFKRTPVSQIQKQLFPWQMLGLVVSSITGLLLFYGQPLRYWGKAFFWMKMATMVFAGVNAMIFHRTTYRSIVAWDSSSVIPTGSKVAGVVSLVLWACVVLFGRLTAYNWLTYE
jgi:hypothetical protein